MIFEDIRVPHFIIAELKNVKYYNYHILNYITIFWWDKNWICVYVCIYVYRRVNPTSHECYVTRKFPSLATEATSRVVKERRKGRDTMEVAQ